MSKKTLEAIRTERRRHIANGLYAGMTYREMATKQEVALSTVHSDVKAILKALQKETLQDAEKYRRVELRRLDLLHNKAWIQANQGNLQAIDRLLKIQDQRAKYLTGVQDNPRQEHTGANGGPIEYLAQLRTADAEIEEWEKTHGVDYGDCNTETEEEAP